MNSTADQSELYKSPENKCHAKSLLERSPRAGEIVSLEERSSYLRFIHMARLPNEIVLPGAVAWNLVALGEARARDERTGSSISIEGSLLVNTSHVWAAYWESKTIYTIEPAVVGQFEMRGLLLPLFSWTARDR